MRIIAGKYRGRTLKSPPSLQTRPTSDRLRETLFNILTPRIAGARFLDLCAGTGAVGIEALSRDAEHVTFVDQSRRMCTLVKANLNALEVDAPDFEIVCSEASKFLRRYVKNEALPFDIIFFDPPYSADYGRVLDQISENQKRLLEPNGSVVVEHFRKNDISEVLGELCRRRTVTQGDSCLSFYR